jgi:anti-sigma regulatory factor (Ser/Thr protein kinase)
MPERLDLTIANSIEELDGLLGRAAEFARGAGLSDTAVFGLQLVIEEAVVNVIRYAYPGDERHEIELHMEVGEAEVRVEVVDAGAAFDPTRIPPADVTAPIDERPIGGLGMHLIRATMDQVGYHRHDGRNHLAMTKRLPPDWRKDG